MKQLRVGLIGFGAIGRSLANALKSHPEVVLVGALVRSRKAGHAAMALFDDLSSLLAQKPDIVVECAGHSGLAQYGASVIARGSDLMVASVGALADAALEAALREASALSGRRVLLPSGALGGLDALAAARLAGLDKVVYLSRKSPKAWKGTPAQDMVDLDRLSEKRVFFSGDARTAALTFPQNANVAAAVALAGLGFEGTRVELAADPDAKGNSHTIMATGAFGAFEFAITGHVLPDNPKTSWLTPYSLAQGLLKLNAAIAFA